MTPRTPQFASVSLTVSMSGEPAAPLASEEDIPGLTRRSSRRHRRDDDPLSPLNVLEYLRSPPPRTSSSFPELKVKTTILQGVRTRSPSPTPPSYPGYSAEAPKLSSVEPNKFNPSLWSGGGTTLMGTYLGDCAKYPSNRNYGSHLSKPAQPTGLPTGLPLAPSPRKPVRPTSLQEPNFCLSCPPNRLGFSAALGSKQQDPEVPGEVSNLM